MSTLYAASLADQVDALLPQTQCGRCGHAGCRPYAEAIAAGSVPINRCPPGGEAVIVGLAALLGTEVLPLDAAYGPAQAFAVARIDEDTCIGCTLCIAACPVDAIVGAAKQMHTVIAERCTGCELCLPPCPVECFVMLPAGRGWTTGDADRARARHAAREVRIAGNAATGKRAAGAEPTRDARQAAVAAALTRARARRVAARGAGG